MKVKTPVLELDDFGEDYGVENDDWVCLEWVEHYFDVTPPKLSLEFSDKPTKETVPINLCIGELNSILWAPATRSRIPLHSWRETYAPLGELLREALPISEKPRRFYVTVWIYE